MFFVKCNFNFCKKEHLHNCYIKLLVRAKISPITQLLERYLIKENRYRVGFCLFYLILEVPYLDEARKKLIQGRQKNNIYLYQMSATESKKKRDQMWHTTYQVQIKSYFDVVFLLLITVLIFVKDSIDKISVFKIQGFIRHRERHSFRRMILVST